MLRREFLARESNCKNTACSFTSVEFNEFGYNVKKIKELAKFADNLFSLEFSAAGDQSVLSYVAVADVCERQITTGIVHTLESRLLTTTMLSWIASLLFPAPDTFISYG